MIWSLSRQLAMMTEFSLEPQAMAEVAPDVITELRQATDHLANQNCLPSHTLAHVLLLVDRAAQGLEARAGQTASGVSAAEPDGRERPPWRGQWSHRRR